jgi:glycerophosphoryl diester phosphodiesterase
LIEVKDQHGALGPVPGRLEQAVAAALRDYDGPVAVMSFNPHSVAALAEHAPDIPRGLVTCSFIPDDWPDVPVARLMELAAIPDYAATGCSFISHDWQDLGADVVSQLKGQGAHILCWTIRSADDAQQALRVARNITFEAFLP